MAGRLNLATTGIEDTFLTSSPKMSHFLSTFKRHTPFAFEINECQFDGVKDYGELITCRIPTFKGDFIKNLTVKLARNPLSPRGTSWSPSFMSRLVEFAELYIGSQLIEKITGEYIYLYQQLRNNDYDTRQTLYFLTGHGDLLDYYEDEYIYFLDLPFHFYRNPELSIPICALTKQSVEVRLKLRDFSEVILDKNSFGGKINRLSLNVEYVYVAPEERAFFMSSEISRIITQVQLSEFKMDLKKEVMLNFKHPIKEMLFVSQSNVASENNFSNQYNTIKSLELKLNNETLFHKTGKEVGYDHTLEKYLNSPIASEFGGPIEIEQRKFGPSIFGVHTFGLHPTESEPSGHLNMSRISHKLLNIEIEPLTNINTNTLTTQIDTENSSIPFTISTDTQVPFTETVTEDTTTTTTTPVTVTNNITTKKEQVETTVTTATTVTQTIGLSLNPIQPTAVADVVTVTTLVNTLNLPVNVVIVSEVDGTPVITIDTSSSTDTIYQNPVVGPPSETLGQKTIVSTASESTFRIFTRTGTIGFTPPSTQIEFTDTLTSVPTTTTPVRVIGDIDNLLRNSVDSEPLVNTDATNDNGTTNINGNATENLSLTSPGSEVVFGISNPTLTEPTNAGTAGGSGTGVSIRVFSSRTNPDGSITSVEVVSEPPPTTIKFDIETDPSEYGSICKISKDGSRIISTHAGDYLGVAAYIYRHILEITEPATFGGFVPNETFIREYFVSNKTARVNPNVVHTNNTAKQTVINFDGSVIVGSNYRQINYPIDETIDIWRYTESWAESTVGQGTWSTIVQFGRPSNLPRMHYGHSMSMDKLGNRFAVSGIVIPGEQSTDANVVVIYNYSNDQWSSNQIQLPIQSGNYGVQVALTGDGNTLCVSMHGNDTGTINCDGRIFLYTYINNTWSFSEELYLPTPDPSNPSRSMFGRSIAISDDAEKIIVGAPNWNGGCAFLYCLIDNEQHQITPNTSGLTNFGTRVDISSDGERIIIGSRSGGIEIWSHEDCTTDASFVSYHNASGTGQITDVSISEDGSKFVYSSPDTNKIYINDSRVTISELDRDSADYRVTSRLLGEIEITNRVPLQPRYKVDIKTLTSTAITTVVTTTPFDSVQEVQEEKTRIEVNETTRDNIITGIENTITSEEGIRTQTETTTTQSLLTVPVTVSQEHDTRVYAVNYNVLVFRDGLAGLRF